MAEGIWLVNALDNNKIIIAVGLSKATVHPAVKKWPCNN